VTDRTRVVCLPWVHSFSGHVLDLDAIGQICRSSDALFVVNGSQGVGALPISVRHRPIDVLISVGFKWLCGPYGTGFAWLGPRALERIRPTKLYWLSALTTEDLEEPHLDLRTVSPEPPGCFDIFGTANFFNFAGLLEAIE
jgi:cysteine desulfurase/selenocysteine lyase